MGEPYVDEDEDGDWDDLAYYADGYQEYDDSFWADGDDYADAAADDEYSEVYDVEEYDEIYAGYADAKAKMNQMRVSHGFYPVVAVVERPQSPGKGKSYSSSPKKGKGKKGRGKTKRGPVTPRASGRKYLPRHGCNWPTDVPEMWPSWSLGEELPICWRQGEESGCGP